MTHSFEITLTERDLVDAFRLNARNPAIRPLILAAAVVAAILILLLAISPEARLSATSRPLTLMLEGALALAALLLVALAVFLRPIWRWMARRALAQRQDLANPIHYSFDEKGLSQAATFTNANYPWPALRSWRESEGILLVYISDQLFYPIPKSQVDEGTVDALRHALASSGVRKR